ncbi:GNAT family N-acetyltransferase [Saccharolobus caldissimus]|uniref:N-acetyltransferase domain-containing protein n=1 Tax=Saccharolobus caldissimus TaxID=1702097 RepID=A0AAQ4CTK9_9CREN|nr:GNAT family N-acetyltransferase [Saccharolobus caldissimus]BDB99140.1 hypothetical protein SACC_21570 [Saccharolobus caldissimus]
MSKNIQPYDTISTPLGNCYIYTIHSYFINKLASFDCGEKEQNDFIKRFAVGHYLAGINHTFLLICNNDLAGFISFSSYSYAFAEGFLDKIKKAIKEEFNKRGLPHEFDVSFKKLPVILLGQLGIDKRYQGKGLGRSLIREFVIPYSLNYCAENSCIGILVYTRSAKDFYRKLGFQLIYEDKNGGANYFYSLYKNVLEIRYKTFSSKP